jgi:hypothetical protein
MTQRADNETTTDDEVDDNKLNGIGGQSECRIYLIVIVEDGMK